jgi:hypothetical protein
LCGYFNVAIISASFASKSATVFSWFTICICCIGEELSVLCLFSAFIKSSSRVDSGLVPPSGGLVPPSGGLVPPSGGLVSVP